MRKIWNRLRPSNRRSRKTGLLCANWGVSVKEGLARPTALTEGMPPLKIHSDGTIDLEFGPLLLVDFIAMDSAAYARLQTEVRTPALTRLRETLRALYGEGYLQLIDYEPIFSTNRAWILDSSSKQAADPSRWLDVLRKAVTGWEDAREKFRGLVEPYHYDMAMHIPYGIFAFLSDAGEPVTEENYQKIRRIIFSEKKRIARSEHEVRSMCLKPYLDHVFSCIAVQTVANLPLADWANLRPMYEVLHLQARPNQPSAYEAQNKVRELFACSIPDFEPSSVSELLRLLDDNRIAVLREFIRVAVQDGHQFRQSDLQQILRDIHGIDRKQSWISSALNVAGLFAGFGAGAGGVGAAAGAGAAVAISTAQELGQRSASGYLHRDYAWLYLLMENKPRVDPTSRRKRQ